MMCELDPMDFREDAKNLLTKLLADEAQEDAQDMIVRLIERQRSGLNNYRLELDTFFKHKGYHTVVNEIVSGAPELKAYSRAVIELFKECGISHKIQYRLIQDGAVRDTFLAEEEI